MTHHEKSINGEISFRVSTLPLNSEQVSEFFTPAADQLNNCKIVDSTPRNNIIEAAKRLSKTLTFNYDPTLNSKLDEDESKGSGSPGYYRLERLDSEINPGVTAKLDYVAHRLGFQLPPKCGRPENVSGDSLVSWEDLNLENEIRMQPEAVASENRVQPETCNPRRSMFSTILKRISTIRANSVESHRHQRTASPMGEKAQHMSATNPVKNPIKLHRWFSRRIRRFKSTKSVDWDNSDRPSVDSAGDFLDERVEPPCFDAECTNTSRQSNLPEDSTSMGCISSNKQNFTSLDFRHDFPTSAIVNINTVDSRRTFPSGVSHDGSFWLSSTPFSSHAPDTLQRDDSIRSTLHRRSLAGTLPLVRDTSHSEATNLHRSPLHNGGPPAPALSDAQLLLPQSSTYSPSPTANAPDYVPSYLNISVAAFGYSSYLRNSFSFRNITDTPSRLTRPSALFLSEDALLAHSTMAGTEIVPSERGKSVPPETVHGPSQSKNAASKQLLSRPCQLVPSDHRQLPINHYSNMSGDDPFEAQKDSIGNQEPQYLPDQFLSNGAASDKSFSNSSPVNAATANSPQPTDVVMRRRRVRHNTPSAEDQEHFHRSSLIMFAVAHASPRARPATHSFDECSEFAQDPSLEHRPFKTNIFSFPDECNRMNDSILFESSVPSPPETAYNNMSEQLDITEPTPNPSSDQILSPNHACPVDPHPVKIRFSVSPHTIDAKNDALLDGRYFLHKVDQTQQELQIKIEQVEGYLSGPIVMDEEVSGILRSAIGSARLLITEKFKQFRGLCRQNLEWEAAVHQRSLDSAAVNTANRDDDHQLVPLASDLDGFWAMVTIQVDDVRSKFHNVERLRCNNWNLLPIENGVNGKTAEVDHTILVNGTVNSEDRSTTKKQLRRPRASVTPAAERTPRIDSNTPRQKARERLAQAKRDLRAKQSSRIANNSPSTNENDRFMLII